MVGLVAITDSVIELRLLADLAKALFPLALVRQWISVRTPKFLHHLALRHERTFRLGILVNAVPVLQRQLRAGDDWGSRSLKESRLTQGKITALEDSKLLLVKSDDFQRLRNSYAPLNDLLAAEDR